jgi:T4 RnlA family RNA ligase
MFYKFPDNMTLNETRTVVAAHNEKLGVKAFIEADRGDLVIFNYVVSFEGSFEEFTGDPVRDREIAIIRECRGIAFDKATGQIAIRKFHKFFNVGQRAETQSHMIDWTQPHDILLKEDGSMITPYLGVNGWEWHTKMGATDVAKLADDFVAKNPKYNAFASNCLEQNKTPLFEFCSRKQKIVVDYPEDKLVLLAVRDNITGEYLPFGNMEQLGRYWDIPVVERIEGKVDIADPAAFLEKVRVLQGQEGYIVRFHNGHMVKVKAEDYLRLHNMVDTLQREKDVLALVLSGSLDDAKAFMSDDSRQRVDAYVEAIERAVAVTAKRLADFAEKVVAETGGDQKRIAMEYVNVETVPQRERGMIFQIIRGLDASKVVLDYVRKNTGTGTKVAEVRSLIGDVKWDDFRDTAVVIED